MENDIKEAKNGFYLDHMNSHSFQLNEAKMMFSLFAYNLTNWLRTLCFPEEQKNMQIETIRSKIIKVASKLVKSGRSLYFKIVIEFRVSRLLLKSASAGSTSENLRPAQTCYYQKLIFKNLNSDQGGRLPKKQVMVYIYCQMGFQTTKSPNWSSIKTGNELVFANFML